MTIKDEINQIYKPGMTDKEVWFELVTKYYAGFLYFNSRKGSWSASLDNFYDYVPTKTTVKRYIKEIKNGK